MEQGKPSSALESPLIDFDAVCQRVREAMEPARTHAVSLHDQHGEVLWLSESSMGPDEHNAVREAIETFSQAGAAPVLAHDLGDSRSAVLLRVVSSRRVMVGVVMVIMDSRMINQDTRGPAKLMTPKLQRSLAEFAAMRPDPAPPSTSGLALDTGGLSLAPDPVPVTPRASEKPTVPPASRPATAPAVTATASRTPPARTAPGRTAPVSAATPTLAAMAAAMPRSTPPPAAAKAAGFTGQQPAQSVSPEIDRLHAALRRSPIALHVQRLVPLTKGSRTKRYEVLLRSKSDNSPNAAPHAMLKAAVDHGLGSMIDRRVITELIGWLVRHPAIWQIDEVMFSVNLTATALHDDHFIKFVELCLVKSSLPKGTIAFEVDAPTALKHSGRMSDVAASLHRLGCPLVLDDFALRTECFALLRLPGVRYVKLAPEITAKMRTDKLSQAAITAVVQMARVLGMHTVAKRAESAAEQEWLTALGVDFIQSHAMSPPVAIESLHKPASQRA